MADADELVNADPLAEAEVSAAGKPLSMHPQAVRSRRRKQRERDAASASASSSAAKPMPGLEGKLRGPLEKVAEWLEGRDPELAQILHEDGAKMAKLLAKVAASTRAPALVVAAIRALANLLEPVDAFGRLVALLFARWRETRRARRAERELEAELEAEAVAAGSNGQPGAFEEESPVTPSRFRFDTEPPEVG